MNFVGVDLHKQTSWFCVLNENGQKILSKNIKNNEKELLEFIDQIPKPFNLALESTYNWYFFVDLVQPFAEKIYLANP